MSVIETIIGSQAFEIIRDRIADILQEEINNQVILTSDNDIRAEVFIERSVAFDHTNMPAINVMLARGDYENMTAIKSDGRYSYHIDCYAQAKSVAAGAVTPVVRGDERAAKRVQKILGLCRAILEDAQYVTLGFAKPYIKRVTVMSIQLGDWKVVDNNLNEMMGRLTLVVEVPENVNIRTPNLIAGYKTKILVGESDRGYLLVNS